MERRVHKVNFHRTKDLNLTRVAAYARVSSGKDAMLHSLSAQVSYYSRIIQEHPGWLYCGVYADEAMTGTKEDRENFQTMLDACRRGEIDLILCKSISRFARNTVTLLETVRSLKDQNVDIYFEEQNIHTMSADGELMLTILASYAQEESRSASENQKWRIRKGFENGELLNWRFLYGYDIDRAGIRINPEKAEQVRDIFHSFLAGESMNGIANRLNSEGIPGTFGARWSQYQIRCILSNEKYTGNALLQKHYRNNHIEKQRKTNHGELKKYYVEGSHEAIIDQETFTMVQSKLATVAMRYENRPKGSRCGFSGKIICAQCGKTYKRHRNSNLYIWNCTTYLEQGKRQCPGLQIREDILKEAAAQALGLAEYDETAFNNRIDHIRSGSGKQLTFYFKGSGSVSIPWQNKSRSSSWTPEMREAARQRNYEQRRQLNGKSHSNPSHNQPNHQAAQ